MDSSVTAALLDKAIGKQLVCVFVNHGLLREGESSEITKIFKERLGNRFINVDASDMFLNALRQIKDPEEKRKIIGKKFIEVFELEANKLGNIEYLAQGTLYPDVIESISFSVIEDEKRLFQKFIFSIIVKSFLPVFKSIITDKS